MTETEKVSTSADYRQCKIHITNRGRFFVEIDGLSYPVTDLNAAKSMIDSYWKTKGN